MCAWVRKIPSRTGGSGRTVLLDDFSCKSWSCCGKSGVQSNNHFCPVEWSMSPSEATQRRILGSFQASLQQGFLQAACGKPASWAMPSTINSTDCSSFGFWAKVKLFRNALTAKERSQIMGRMVGCRIRGSPDWLLFLAKSNYTNSIVTIHIVK